MEHRFAYPRGGEQRLQRFGLVMLLVAGIIAVVPEADVIGIPLPTWAHVSAIVLSLAMGVRFVTWAGARRRSEDPAVAIAADTLRLHVHPGRPLQLSRDEVVAVGPVEESQDPGTRFFYGPRAFSIQTTAMGLRTLDLRIGERTVAAPLEEVRGAIDAFLGTPTRVDERGA